jgi:hypothetical protein
MVTVAVVLVAVARAGPAGRAALAGLTGPGGATRAISVTAGSVGTVELQGVPGRLTIVGTSADQVILTGQLRWTGQAPVVVTWLDRAAHVLRLSYRCAPASPCTENYRLSVPRSTTTVVRQSAGNVVVSGLAGPLRITAVSANIRATGLRSPTLVAAITSGQLSATFDAAPRRVSIALKSALVTLRLPGSSAYQVSKRVTSGYINIAIPQDSTAANTVTALVDSGELELLRS